MAQRQDAPPTPRFHLRDIHETHVRRIAGTWTSLLASDDPEQPSFAPQLMVVCRDRNKRAVERVHVAPSVEEREAAAAVLGRSIARGGLRPFAVTAAFESWMATDDGSGRAPSARTDRVEVLAVTTALANGRSLTTLRKIERSIGGEALLGETVVEADSGYDAALLTVVFAEYRDAMVGR